MSAIRDDSALAGPAAAAQQRGLSQERAAWFWTDEIVPRLPFPAWVAAVGMWAALVAIGCMVAMLFDVAPTYIRDVRWPASYAALALSMVYLAYLPREIATLWPPLRQWLVDPDAEISRLQREGPRALASFFTVSFLLWVMFAVIWIAFDSFGDRYESPAFARLLNLVHLPFLVYFVGSAGGISTIGTWRFVRLISRTLDIKPGLVVQGKAALRPLNRLLWRNWLYLLVLMSTATLTATPLSGSGMEPADFLLWVLVTPFFVLLLAGQLSMNGLLAREKAAEVRRLRQHLEQERTLPDDASELTVLRSLHRVQLLLHEVQQAESFNPTLVDTRFIVQIGLSVTAIILANVLLRTVLADLLPT